MTTSSTQDELVAALSAAGVATSYRDAFGIDRQVPAATLEQLAGRMLTGEPRVPAPLIATPGRFHPDLFGDLTYDDGRTVRASGIVDVAGYHHLTSGDGLRRLVIAAPEYLPQPTRQWGWAVQLYAARTRDSWGIGDFRDLATIARRAARAGAGSILISPVNAAAPTTHQTDSPYSPTSREWLNLLHVAPGAVPGAERVDLADLVAAGRALNADRRIDRDAVWALKLAALERVFAAVSADLPAEFAVFAAAGGSSLRSFATFSAIAEVHGMPWWSWPEELKLPGGPAVAAFADAHAGRVEFFTWCQWVADLQLAAACASGVEIVVDLPVGFDAGGADGWAWQELCDFSFEVGCPPDGHNVEGQKWGLPPLDPQALMAAEFAPFISMVRAGLRHASALRMDHVMQLWRLFWVPGSGARDGVYVHYPVDALLAILRVEACRAGAWVVGEDMGTVADGVRETMAAIGMLGYRTSMRTDPDLNPAGSMGSVATHDQATIAGTLRGTDADDMLAIGKGFDVTHVEHTRRELAASAGVDPDGRIGAAEVAAAVRVQHQRLAESPSVVVLATLDDAAGVAERPNMPGTIDEWANWRIALPAPVEDILDAELAGTVAATLAAAGRPSPGRR